MTPVGLVSWGRRGASVRLAHTSGLLLRELGHPYFLSVSSAALDQYLPADQEAEIHIVQVPRQRLRTLVSPILADQAVKQVVRAMRDAEVQRIVILMPHPWDHALVRQAHRWGIHVCQVIHDAARHPGDLWPTRSAINRRLRNADEVIFLSEQVAERASHLTRRFRIAPQPVRVSIGEEHRARPVGGPRALFVGRFRSYKGLDALLTAWALIRTPHARLLIAGDGKLPTTPVPPGARIVRKWLSDTEIEEMIANSDVVVLPYSEASQSGIIPIARALGRPVVCTPVGGLQEQYIEGVSGLTAASLDPTDIAMAIDTALGRTWSVLGDESDNHDFVQALLGL